MPLTPRKKREKPPRFPDMADFLVHTFHQVCGLADVKDCPHCIFKRWSKARAKKRRGQS
jgi:hypothetical protein